LNQEKYEEAESRFSAVLRADPKNGKAHVLRGGCRMARGRYRDAVADFDRAIALGENRAETYRNRGVCYLQGLGERSPGLADLVTADLLAAGTAVKLAERDLEAQLRRWLEQWHQVTLVVAVPQYTEVAPLTLHAQVVPPGSPPGTRPRVYRAEVASEALWQKVSDLLVRHAGSLQEAEEWDTHDTPYFRTSCGVRLTFQPERPRELTVASGRTLKLTSRVLGHFWTVQASTYRASRTAIMVSEAHNSLDEQLATLQGLEALLADNPWLKDRGATAFLVEAWQADKVLSLGALTRKSPNPAASLVQAALGTFLIPSYVAFEWQHRLGIPLIGHEDMKLYRLCNYLHWGTGTGKWQGQDTVAAEGLQDASVAARNQSSGQTFVRALQKYRFPILFIGQGHVGPYSWDAEEKRKASRPEMGKESKWLARLFPAEPRDWLEAVNRRSVASYLRDEGIGWVHLAPRTNPFLSASLRQRHLTHYTALRKAQHDGNLQRILAPYRRAAQGGCTTMPAPEALAAVLPALAGGLSDAHSHTPAARAGHLADLLSDCGTLLGCFPAGTPVHTAAGLRPIETIRAGDRVWACEPTSGRWGLQRVTAALRVVHDGEFLRVRAGSTVVVATASHPFWVRSRQGVEGGWVEAGNLRVGDVLLDRCGAPIAIAALDRYAGRGPVFTLQVEKAHTFAVGPAGLLVHNHCKFPPGLLRGDRGGLRKALEKRYEREKWDVPPRCQAHHLIPVAEARKSLVMRLAATRHGYSINRTNNGIFLPNNADDAGRLGLPYHSSDHKQYSAYVGKRLKDLDARYVADRRAGRKWNPSKFRREIRKLENELRERITSLTPGKRLSRHTPAQRETQPRLRKAAGREST
jgi:tetratricopeptide (TPR) repeat protein